VLINMCVITYMWVVLMVLDDLCYRSSHIISTKQKIRAATFKHRGATPHEPNSHKWRDEKLGTLEWKGIRYVMTLVLHV
jgi:hypothetical protein